VLLSKRDIHEYKMPSKACVSMLCAIDRRILTIDQFYPILLKATIQSSPKLRTLSFLETKVNSLNVRWDIVKRI
jgi:hypothetical protein